VDLSICALLYGGYYDLATRCLGSISISGVSSVQKDIQDIRVGLNEVCPDTRRYVEMWARKVTRSCSFPVIVFERQGPQRPTKYPMMRRMFYHPSHPLGSHVMWFDDDSYIVPRKTKPYAWWHEVLKEIDSCDLLGQSWNRPIEGKQREWISQQPWADPSTRPLDRLYFCQGGWWCADADRLAAADYPFPVLQHNGGDSMLGELARQQLWDVKYVPENYKDVRINADSFGHHSEAKRRGISNDKDIGVFRYSSSVVRNQHKFKSLVHIYQDGFLVQEDIVDDSLV
jgi:hypothetical protein